VQGIEGGEKAQLLLENRLKSKEKGEDDQIQPRKLQKSNGGSNGNRKTATKVGKTKVATKKGEC